MTEDAASFRRIAEEVIVGGNVELIDELLAEDYIEHAAPPGFPTDRSSLGMYVKEIHTGFPDFKYEILGQWQDGDIHIGHIRGSGTMTGALNGMPPSNKSARWDEIHIGRFAGGKLAEHWAVIDQLGMLTQLGFVPPMGG